MYQKGEFSVVKILIVEDEPSIAEVVSAYAKREGYDTVTATDGMSALEIFERDEISLVILDLMLPKLSGKKSAGESAKNPKSQ